jgi:hypothetical protein
MVCGLHNGLAESDVPAQTVPTQTVPTQTVCRRMNQATVRGDILQFCEEHCFLLFCATPVRYNQSQSQSQSSVFGVHEFCYHFTITEVVCLF